MTANSTAWRSFAVSWLGLALFGVTLAVDYIH